VYFAILSYTLEHKDDVKKTLKIQGVNVHIFHSILSPVIPLTHISYENNSTYHRGKDRSWTYIYMMNVIHSAPTKKSLSKSFFGLQPSGFRLSQAKTFFYWSHSNFLQYNNPLIKHFQRKLIELTKIRSGDKGSFTSQPWVKTSFFAVTRRNFGSL